MIVTTILGIIMAIALIFAIIGFMGDYENMGVIGFSTFLIFMLATGIAGSIELHFGEERTACRTYCNEQDYSYDSVQLEGEEQYCICDTGLERHLIKKNTGVIIE